MSASPSRFLRCCRRTWSATALSLYLALLAQGEAAAPWRRGTASTGTGSGGCGGTGCRRHATA